MSHDRLALGFSIRDLYLGPFLTPFLVGRVPLLEIDYRKNGTLILTSLLEDLVYAKLEDRLRTVDNAYVLDLDALCPIF